MEDIVEVIRQEFGKDENDLIVYKYIVKGQNIKAEFCETGAAIMSFEIENIRGEMTDVVLGLDTNSDYMRNWPAFGAVIGRCANRIKGASFILNGKKYKLKKNIMGGCLHSGYGYHFRKWNGSCNTDESGNAHIIFKLNSEDGDQGFPGNLEVTVEYIVSDDKSLTIRYDYISDMDTVVNLTNHCYFNMNGHDSGAIVNHKVKINSDRVTKTDRNLMPTGEIVSVAETAYDFTKPVLISENMKKSFKPVSDSREYDINYVIGERQGEYKLAAELESTDSGIGMRVYTDMPGMQFYTANAVKGIKGKKGIIYKEFPAVCFETQFYPDAINIEHFPSPVVRAGEKKSTVTKFEFYNGENKYNG